MSDSSQVQVGGVTLQNSTDNPLAGALSGVSTGMDWAVKRRELDLKTQAIQAEVEKNRVEAAKHQFAIGDKLYERMGRIARLPFGKAKDSEIDLLGNDMQQLGLELHPSAKALMTDKIMGTALPDVLEALDSPDPATKVQARQMLPQILDKSNEKIVDMYTKKAEEAGKDRRNTVTALSQIQKEGDRRKFELELKQREMDAADARQKNNQGFELNKQESHQNFEQGQQGRKIESDEKIKIAEAAAAKQKDIATKTLDQSNKFRDDSKPYRDQIDVVNKILDLKDKKGYAEAFSGDAARTLFAKLTDPTTGVREGEVTRVAKLGGGIIDRVGIAVDRFLNGKELSDKQWKQIEAVARGLGKDAEKGIDTMSKGMIPALRKAGVDPADVFTNTPTVLPPVKKPKGPAAGALLPPGTIPSAAPSPAPSAAPSGALAVPPPASNQLNPGMVSAGKAMTQLAGGDPAKLQDAYQKITTRLGRHLSVREKGLLGFPPNFGGP